MKHTRSTTCLLVLLTAFGAHAAPADAQIGKRLKEAAKAAAAVAERAAASAERAAASAEGTPASTGRTSRISGRALIAGQTVTSSLDQSNPRVGHHRAEVYVFTGKRGERVEISMASKQFDTHLELGRMDGDDWVTILVNDNAGNATTDSRITTVLDDDKQYIIRAIGHYNSEGIYTLRLVSTPPTQPATADPQPASSRAGIRPIRAGQTVEAALDQSDPRVGHHRAEVYAFTGKRGERVEISMASKQFDTYLELGRMDGDDWVTILVNDNASSATTDSRIVAVLPQTGEYIIRARGHYDPEGIYTLRLVTRP